MKVTNDDQLKALLDSVEDGVGEITTQSMEGQEEAVMVATGGASLAGDIESLAAELGIDLSGANLQEPTPESVVKEPKKKREPKPKAEKAPKPPKESKQPKPKVEKAPKAEKPAKEPKAEKTERIATTKVAFRMDAPIPVVKFRDLVIGYYGNILEPLPAPDTEGFTWKEIEKQKYIPIQQEGYRMKGRAVLITNEASKRYLVGVEEGGVFEGVIEVSNRGRGKLRCRQIAAALGLAYLEKADEILVTPEQYMEYLAKTQAPQMNLGA